MPMEFFYTFSKRDAQIYVESQISAEGNKWGWKHHKNVIVKHITKL